MSAIEQGAPEPVDELLPVGVAQAEFIEASQAFDMLALRYFAKPSFLNRQAFRATHESTSHAYNRFVEALEADSWNDEEFCLILGKVTVADAARHHKRLSETMPDAQLPDSVHLDFALSDSEDVLERIATNKAFEKLDQRPAISTFFKLAEWDVLNGVRYEVERLSAQRQSELAGKHFRRLTVGIGVLGVAAIAATIYQHTRQSEF